MIKASGSNKLMNACIQVIDVEKLLALLCRSTAKGSIVQIGPGTDVKLIYDVKQGRGFN